MIINMKWDTSATFANYRHFANTATANLFHFLLTRKNKKVPPQLFFQKKKFEKLICAERGSANRINCSVANLYTYFLHSEIEVLSNSIFLFLFKQPCERSSQISKIWLRLKSKQNVFIHFQNIEPSVLPNSVLFSDGSITVCFIQSCQYIFSKIDVLILIWSDLFFAACSVAN